MSTDQTPAPKPVVMLEVDHALLKDPGPVDTITLIAKGGILLTQQEWDRKPPEPPTAEELYAALVSKLHEKCIHPDYEYESVEHQRKSCADSNPPAGAGWEENLDYDRGYTRYDYTEDHHWRRLKSHRLTDEPELYKLAPITLDKMSRSVFESNFHISFRFGDEKALLCQTADYGSLGIVQPPPLRVPVVKITSLEALREDEALMEQSGLFELDTGEVYFVHTEKAVRALLRLFEDTKDRYQCVARLGNGKWGSYRDWSDYTDLPLNPLALQQVILAMIKAAR